MKILMLSGSKNHEGRTAGILEVVSRGAENAGAETETLFLCDMNLEYCRQCNPDGWGICRNEGRCVIKDDLQSIVDKIEGSDVVVFATPVYFRDLSEPMKVFLDRLRRMSCFVQSSPTHGKIAAGICLAGGGGGGSVQAALNLESTLQMCRFDVVDSVPVRRQNFEHKLPMFEMTGAWLATKPSSDSVPR